MFYRKTKRLNSSFQRYQHFGTAVEALSRIRDSIMTEYPYGIASYSRPKAADDVISGHGVMAAKVNRLVNFEVSSSCK